MTQMVVVIPITRDHYLCNRDINFFGKIKQIDICVPEVPRRSSSVS